VDVLSAGLPGLNVQAQLNDDALDRLIDSGPFAQRCNPAELLSRSIALFKTPGLRDLGHSAPYMHTGQFDTLDEIVTFYQRSSDLQREGRLRNGDRELAEIRLADQDITPLAAFLRSLNEDYE
jgi:cytochrome c peroxidase